MIIRFPSRGIINDVTSQKTAFPMDLELFLETNAQLVRIIISKTKIIV